MIGNREIVIASAARTPIGSYGGSLSGMTAPKLGSIAIKAALERANISADLVDEVIMGNVLTAGVGQAPARQAAIFAGIPNKTPCMTINKVCGSGLKAVMLAAQSIALGDSEAILTHGLRKTLELFFLVLAKARRQTWPPWV